MAAGDVYVTWDEENPNRGVINLVHHQPDNLVAQDKTDMSAAADGGATVLAANWTEPASTTFNSKAPVIDPATEVADEITAVTWEDKAISIDYATFRTLLEAQEKVDIDSQSGLSQADADQCVSYLEDLKSYADSETLKLDKTEVNTIVNWFETKTLIAAGRAATILAGTLPV